MIGAIKRRWKSKKAKVLHKGSELSTTSDSCPTSRGFVDEEFDKMIKPPSPRQVHPLSEKGEIKHAHQAPLALLQHHAQRKKSSTLPSSEEVCPFIRVNSGRIELVRHPNHSSCKSVMAQCSSERFGSHQDSPYSLPSEDEEDILECQASNTGFTPGGRYSREIRHSWAGSAPNSNSHGGAKGTKTALLLHQREEKDERGGGTSFVPKIEFNQVLLEREEQQTFNDDDTEADDDTQKNKYEELNLGKIPMAVNEKRIAALSNAILSFPCEDKTTEFEVKGGSRVEINSALLPHHLLSPLRERLCAIEEITTNLQGLKSQEKSEYEKIVRQLADQVSKAIALHREMKVEVEKLESRVAHLEIHNKTIETVVIPTIIKIYKNFEREKNAVLESSLLDFSKEEDTSGAKQVGQKSPSKMKKVSGECRIPKMNGKVPCSPGSRRIEKEAKRNVGNVLSCRQLNTSPSTNRYCQQPVPSPSNTRSTTMPMSRSESNSHNTTNTGKTSDLCNMENTSSQAKYTTSSGIPRITPVSSPRQSSRNLPPSPSNRLKEKRNGKSDLPPSPSKPPRHINSITNSSVVNGEVNASSLNPSRLPVRRNNSGGSNIKSLNVVQATKPAPPIRNQVVYKHLTNTNIVTPDKPRIHGKDEGYSTMSSEALAEQEDSSVSSNAPVRPGSSKNLWDKTLEKKGVSSLVATKYSHLPKIQKSSTFNSFESGEKFSSGKSTARAKRDFTSLPVPIGKGGDLHCKRHSEQPLKLLKCQENVNSIASTLHNNVRIIRGSPMAVEVDSSCMLTPNSKQIYLDDDSNQVSSPTILWEDSDDSDILFLPLDITEDCPNTSGSRLTFIISDKDVASTENNAAPPITTTKINRNNEGCEKRKEEAEPQNAPTVEIEMEQKALIEKWMKLENVRNPAGPLEEEWAWDWDGVERVPNPLNFKNLKSIRETILDGDENELDEDDKELEKFITESSSFIFKEAETKKTEKSPSAVISPFTEIDSSTWTKNKENKCGNKNNIDRIESSMEICQKQEGKDIESPSRSFDERDKKGSDDSEVIGIYSKEKKEESEFDERKCDQLDENDGSPPPAIEFTPEFYRLANYESNLSFSDNDSPLISNGHCHTNINGVSFKGKSNQMALNPVMTNLADHLSRRCRMTTCDEDGRMDDKTSQTDFSNSSVETLSVSSELFSECKNCLEMVKKLVSVTSHGAMDEEINFRNNCGSTLDRRLDEIMADLGASPTTWISIPKGLPTSEVDKIMEILSSSESEDVLSPGK